MQALQHTFFQCLLPLPETMKNSKLEKNNEEISNPEENKYEEKMRQKMALEEKSVKNKEGKFTSGYFMRNARYKPGVRPSKIQEK